MTTKWYQSLTPEEKTAYNTERSKRYTLKLSQMSPEELIAHKTRQRVGWKKFNDNLSDAAKKELRKKINNNARNKWQNLSPDMKLEQKIEMAKRGHKIREEQKKLIIDYYSHGEMRCMNPKCEVVGGAKDIRCLTVDHINGGGRKQEKELKQQGTILYRWLIKNNYPSGYQVLCANCQFIKRVVNKECCKHK